MNTLQKFEKTQVDKMGGGKKAPEFAPGDTVEVAIRDKRIEARVVRPPFVRKGRALVQLPD